MNKGAEDTTTRYEGKTVMATVKGPHQSIDVELQATIPADALIAPLLKLFDIPEDAADQWVLIGQNQELSTQTLAEAAILDGTVLTLSPRSTKPPVVLKEPPVKRPELPADGRLPQDRTKSVLPAKLWWGQRMSAACEAVLSRSSTEAEPPPVVSSRDTITPSHLTLRTQPGLVDRWRRSWRETHYLHRLDHIITDMQLERCATIAVVSPKGGVGKTTLTILLGTLLAHLRRDRIVAIDTNPDFGSLGRTLTPDHAVFVDDLIQLMDRTPLTVPALDAKLGRAAHGLMVLPAPTDPGRMARLNESEYTRVVRRLQELVGAIVLDCGTGLQDPASRAARATADQLVLVTDAEPSTASLVAEAARLLRTEGSPPIWLVVNKMSRQRKNRLDLQALGQLVPEARGLLVVPEDPTTANQVARGRFDWSDSPSGWQTAIRQLAVSLVAEWPALQIGKPMTSNH